MPVVNHRNAAFTGLGSTHDHRPLALSAGWMLEEIQVEISFATHTFNQSSWQDWRNSRVGWGVWFGPSSAPTLNWSTNRSDFEMVYWTASPFRMGQSLAEDTGGTAFGATWFWAGTDGRVITIPVYREAVGVQHDIRTIDVISSITSFFTYTSQVAVSARIAQP